MMIRTADGWAYGWVDLLDGTRAECLGIENCPLVVMSPGGCGKPYVAYLARAGVDRRRAIYRQCEAMTVELGDGVFRCDAPSGADIAGIAKALARKGYRDMVVNLHGGDFALLRLAMRRSWQVGRGEFRTPSGATVVFRD